MIAMMQVMEERSMNQRTKTGLKKAGRISAGAGTGIAAVGTSLYGIGKTKNDSHKQLWHQLHPTDSAKSVGNKLYGSLNPNDNDGVVDNIKRGAKEVGKNWDKLTGQ